jgi:hypothetical protein
MSITDVGGASGEPQGTGRTDGNSPKELASAAVRTVKQEAQSFAETAQEKVSEKLADHQETATRTLGDFATAIRKAGDELGQNDRSLAGQLVRQAADGLESFSRSVGDKRPEDLLNAVRDFGRNNPAAFIAGSVLLGIALGRLAKSSEDRRGDEAMTARPGYGGPDGDLSSIGSGAGGSGLVESYPTTPTSADSPYGSEV